MQAMEKNLNRVMKSQRFFCSTFQTGQFDKKKFMYYAPVEVRKGFF